MRKTTLLSSALVAFAAASLLAGCGGGGADSASAAATPLDSQSALTAACTGCGALDASTYAGTGVGLWERTNTNGADLDVPVALTGLSGQDVTLVLTNETGAETAFPAIRTVLSNQVARDSALAAPDDVRARMAKFNRTGWAEQLRQAHAADGSRLLKSVAVNAANYTPGATRNFYHELDQSVRTATLQKQVLASDGLKVNVWVENAEFAAGKVDSALVDQLASDFARAGGIYEMLKSVGGPLWGAHNVDGLIAGASQPLDIVVLNFDRNHAAFGTLGYFWALHTLSRQFDARSNESLSLYLDAETLYLGGPAGRRAVAAAVAHEGLHMSNFYRRAVLKGPTYAFETWLEEMTAMMMEDAAAYRVDPAYNPTRDVRLPDYLSSASYNCALKDFHGTGATCDSYAVNGTFGGFLLRQHGIAFLRNLLAQDAVDSEQALRAALLATGGAQATLERELRRFAVSTIGVLPAGATPEGFGFPARNDSGFVIAGIDAAASAFRRSLPDASPATLAPYGSFAVVRRAARGAFSEVVRVPPGASLSVIVH
jgi:hypothetical protein